jgi:hypothetical protein
LNPYSKFLSPQLPFDQLTTACFCADTFNTTKGARRVLRLFSLSIFAACLSALLVAALAAPPAHAQVPGCTPEALQLAQQQLYKTSGLHSGIPADDDTSCESLEFGFGHGLDQRLLPGVDLVHVQADTR